MNPLGNKKLLLCLLLPLGIAAAFVGGRYSAPEKVVEKQVERVVFKDRVVEKLVEVKVAQKAETRIVYRDRVTTKDGTVTEREVERTDTAEKTDTSKVAERVETREVEKIVEREKRVELRPDWRVGVLAGAQIREPLLPMAGPLILGVEVDRRIVGGFSLGVWANTGGAAGVSLALEF